MSDDLQTLARRLAPLLGPWLAPASLLLPFAQRVLNPFPPASSGAYWGDAPLIWPISVLGFGASVYVNTTNNASNYWTLSVVSAAGALATCTTAGIAANVSSRIAAASVAVQPGASDPIIVLVATATGSPGAIYIAPALSYVRTG